jgi:hypothetical protein
MGKCGEYINELEKEVVIKKRKEETYERYTGKGRKEVNTTLKICDLLFSTFAF